jgi:hypothetical protein
MLGKSAPIDLQDTLTRWPMGDPGKTNAEIIAEHIVSEARDKKERWAIELIADRTEGKPIQAVKQDDGDRARKRESKMSPAPTLTTSPTSHSAFNPGLQALSARLNRLTETKIVLATTPPAQHGTHWTCPKTGIVIPKTMAANLEWRRRC